MFYLQKVNTAYRAFIYFVSTDGNIKRIISLYRIIIYYDIHPILAYYIIYIHIRRYHVVSAIKEMKSKNRWDPMDISGNGRRHVTPMRVIIVTADNFSLFAKQFLLGHSINNIIISSSLEKIKSSYRFYDVYSTGIALNYIVKIVGNSTSSGHIRLFVTLTYIYYVLLYTFRRNHLLLVFIPVDHPIRRFVIYKHHIIKIYTI